MKTTALDPRNRGQDDGAVKPRREPDSSLFELISEQPSEDRTMVGSASSGGGELRLMPRRPPGRCHAKARAFAGEMGRLHAEGYTFEAIREALADAGVVVSNTTVQREVARLRSQSRPGPPAHTDAPPG